MGKRAQRKYDEAKARGRRQEESHQREIDEAMERQTQGRKALSKRQLQSLGYRRNWRGKWVEK